MTPTLTTVLIRPFLNLFFCKRAATDVLKTIDPTQFYTSTSVTATDRLRTMNPRGLCHADCQVGALYFSAVRHLFRVLLLLIFLPRTSNSCSSAETPSSSSPRFMLARPAHDFPPNRASHFTGEYIWSRKRWSEWILKTDLIPLSILVCLCLFHCL